MFSARTFCAGDGPVYEALGFAGPPWHWRFTSNPFEFAFAPFALIELTMWHIAQPDLGLAC